MLKHVVLLKFKDFAEGCTKEENIERVREIFYSLPPLIPEIKALEYDRNVSSLDKSFDAILYTVFEDEEGLDRYLKDPHHTAASEFIVKVREPDGRIVVDYHA